jgi:hypothetical protein
MQDPRMKEQLALAREAGTKAMAKDFFAPTPGAGGPSDAEMEAAPPEAGGEMPAGEPELTPEQLEELLALLAQQQPQE